jgi:hypothetical protein
VGKRNRIALAPEYAECYTRRILDPFDLGALVAELPGDSVTALFCVERDPVRSCRDHPTHRADPPPHREACLPDLRG